jgi:multidrug efflux pump subunit AcrA (membrane-fusion protein)
MKSNIRSIRLVLIVLGLAVGLSLAACSGVSNLFKPAVAEATPLPVVVGDARVIAEGRVVPQTYAALAFPAGGRLETLTAEEGNQVERDAVLAALGDREAAEATLAGAKAEAEAARQALDVLKKHEQLARSQAGFLVEQAKARLVEAQKAFDDTQTRDFRDKLDDKEQTMQDKKTTLDDDKKTLDKYTSLDENNATRVNAQNVYDTTLEAYNLAVYERDQLRSRQDTAQSALDQATETVNQALRDQADVKTGVNPDLLAQAEKGLAAAEAQVKAAERGLANMDLKAPFAGTVAEVKQLEPGIILAAGQTVAILADFSTWYVETTDLTELDIVQVKQGDEVEITLDAIKNATYKGEVTAIARSYTEKSGDILYKVRIRVSDPPEEMRWGMTAQVSFGVK